MPRAGDWLDGEALARNFADLPPPLGRDEARIEAARCLYCFDAPCIRACPTGIDVPTFIRQVLHRDEIGAARTILGANILGGSCARACPTEVLCEGACVDRIRIGAPIAIGRLQRFACDSAAASGADLDFFQPGPPTGKRVALVGSGPAALSCAHDLRKLGHEAEIFEARDLPGGLNTLGLAAYKVSTEFALSEVERVRRLGVAFRMNHPIDAADLRNLLETFDAVFLGVGLGRGRSLGIEGEVLAGVWQALDFIRQTHTRPFADCEVGRHVVILGAGNTAIDAATASRRLGADRVTIAYRQGEENMPAFAYEYAIAKADGVRFEWHARPTRFLGRDGSVTGVELARVDAEPITLDADMVLLAVGQEPLADLVHELPGLASEGGRVVVDPATGATSLPKLFAGGDCLRRGGEVVDAVQDGKVAALGIDAALRSGP